MKFFRIFILLFLAGAVLSVDYTGNSKKDPSSFTYGVSFSRFHADELKLDWKKTFLAIVHDLGVRHFRFSAHWPLTEPADGDFNFTELDFQMKEAQKVGADVILAIGRRVPGWPECHIPSWAQDMSKEVQQEQLLQYMEEVVRRYRDYPNLRYWQVENEVYLAFFSRHACGSLDEDFLYKELELVRSLDPGRPILMTDSGEMSLWYQAYRGGDVFGTSMYLYIWNHAIGKFRYPITPHFFRIKKNLVELFLKDKPAIVIELAAEPWLTQPIVDVPFDEQLERMSIEKFREILSFSSRTGFDTFYLWGAEWWFWLLQKGHPEHWDIARDVFRHTQK